MINKVTTESFIKKAQSIHGNKYDYGLVDYKRCDKKVKIICSIHGIFEQTPNSHTNSSGGRGCPRCGIINRANKSRMSLVVFIQKSKSIHKGKYDYSLVKDMNAHTKANIICPIHGSFYQKPHDHLSGRGCYKCGRKTASSKIALDTDEFIKRSKEVHGDRYDYSKSVYKSSRCDKIEIICKEHGSFFQVPYAHFHGNGCPVCGRERTSDSNKQNPIGWTSTNWEKSANRSKWFDGFKVYIIRCWNDTEVFYKIGRTFLKTSRRFRNVAAMPYNYEIINEFIFDTAKEAFNKEKELKSINKDSKYIPMISFNGRHECFNYICNYD